MTFSLPQAEQNQLILDHRHLVKPIAAKYADGGRFEFEELHSEGTLGLVVAARTWEQRAAFSTYANLKIRGHILDLIKKHREFVPHSGDETELHLLLHEWKGGAVVEGWKTLPTTPEAIAASFEAIRQSVDKDALAVLSRRDQRMVKWHLIKEPRMKLAQVAREERMSYRKAMVIMRNSIRKLRAHIKFHPHLANDRFQIANTNERGERQRFFCPRP